MPTTHDDMGALRADVGRWSDRPRGVHELTALATMAACIDLATEYADRGEIDRGEIDDVSRSLGYRVMSYAQRARSHGHTRFHGYRTAGDADPMRGAPDGYTRVQAATRPERSNSGRTVNVVTRHGRAYAGGLTRAEHSPALTMTPAHLEHALLTAPRTANGMVDAVALTALTDVAYPDLPRLVGADVIAFEEHAQAVDISGSRRVTTRLAKAKPVAWPLVLTVEAVTLRAGERKRLQAHEVHAPSLRPGFIWLGHRHVTRSATVRAQRAAKAKPVDATVTAADVAALADELATALRDATAVPYRVAWSTPAGESGALTVSGTIDRPRLAVSGLPKPVTARNVPALTAAIAKALS